MNNDLISRSELKKAIKKEICNFELPISANEIMPIIDNAPTVEVPENAVNCVLTMFGNCSYNKTGCSDCEIKDKIRKALESERPMGERKTFPTSRLIMQCPQMYCFLSRTRSDIFKDSIGEMNFCPNCGADMRKDGAE